MWGLLLLFCVQCALSYPPPKLVRWKLTGGDPSIDCKSSEETTCPPTMVAILEETTRAKPLSPNYNPRNCELCTKIYDPVCGSNNVSYHNRCMMDCDVGHDVTVVVKHQGVCIEF